MMSMSFDDLRNQVAPGGTTFNPQTAMNSMLTLGGGGGPSMQQRGGQRSLMQLAGPARPVEVPDHAQELQVFFFGPGAERFGRAAGVGVLDAKTTQAACRGKRDFILFEPLDDAVKEGSRLVLVLPLCAGRSEVGQAQAYLASSLARWLGEQKTDGSGRPYGESKDEDPTLRKHFTRAQILAIREFGKESE